MCEHLKPVSRIYLLLTLVTMLYQYSMIYPRLTANSYPMFIIFHCLHSLIPSAFYFKCLGSIWDIKQCSPLCAWLILLHVTAWIPTSILSFTATEGKWCSLAEPDFTWNAFWNSICCASLNSWTVSNQYLDLCIMHIFVN